MQATHVSWLMAALHQHEGLTSLDLGANLLGDEGCSAMSAAVAGGAAPALETLVLSKNGISDRSSGAVCTLLRHCERLTRCAVECS